MSLSKSFPLRRQVLKRRGKRRFINSRLGVAKQLELNQVIQDLNQVIQSFFVFCQSSGGLPGRLPGVPGGSGWFRQVPVRFRVGSGWFR